tara:strand:+ start:409 stop:1251 length:843 start_codon:yes stop_codon:yes gene_type:complete
MVVYYIKFNQNGKPNIGKHKNMYPLVYGHFIRDIIFPFMFFLETIDKKNSSYFIIKQTNHYTYDYIPKIFPSLDIKIVDNAQKNNITNITKINYYDTKNDGYIEEYKLCMKSMSYLIKYRHELSIFNHININNIYKNVFIRRKKNINSKTYSLRIWENEDEYISFLKIKYPDLYCIYIEDLPFDNQIEIFYFVENIYFGYGSECFNLFLCRNLKNVYEHTIDLKILSKNIRSCKELPGSDHPHGYIKENITKIMNVKWHIIPVEITMYKSNTELSGKIIF